ncbi:hypothetical protein J7K41_00450 [Candidatus Micrarchaeota archaeon]|nr:hypothetical protein [Candidatus Micrarchaeota archaeon]
MIKPELRSQKFKKRVGQPIPVFRPYNEPMLYQLGEIIGYYAEFLIVPEKIGSSGTVPF